MSKYTYLYGYVYTYDTLLWNSINGKGSSKREVLAPNCIFLSYKLSANLV